VEDELTRGRRRIDRAVAHRTKSDIAISKFVDQRDQVPNRSSQSVESPDEQDVARTQLLEAGVEPRSITFRAGCLVGEDQLVRDSVISQCIELESQL
jgi:hypothetical protein